MRYMKNVDTGVVMTLAAWEKNAITFFTTVYKESKGLQKDQTLKEYLVWNERQGNFYGPDLVECDKKGDKIVW